MPTLQRSKTVLESIKAHLASVNHIAPTELNLISAYLANFASFILYAEMEEQVSEILKARMQAPADEKLGIFLYKTNASILRRIKKSEIADTVALFGDDAKNMLHDRSDPRLTTNYNNVILGRHNVAHGNTLNLTIEDIEKAIEAGDALLGHIEICIR